MDPQVRKRLSDDIIIHPFIKISCGDKLFGEPIQVKAMVIPKVGDTTSETGESIQYKNKVIIAGDIEHEVNESDEIELGRIGRVPIKSVGSYNALRPGCELIEVYC